MAIQHWLTIVGFALTIIIVAGTVTYHAGKSDDRIAHIEADLTEVKGDIKALTEEAHRIEVDVAIIKHELENEKNQPRKSKYPPNTQPVP